MEGCANHKGRGRPANGAQEVVQVKTFQTLGKENYEGGPMVLTDSKET